METDTTELPAGHGRIASNLQHGELFLFPKGKKSERIRLRFALGDTQRARPLPAGVYKVTGFRQIKKDAKGVEWIWSATSPGYREVTVRAGETATVNVTQKLTTRGRTFSMHGKKRAGFSFVGEKHVGNTIYRDGKRIPITWEAMDAEGKVCASGPMAYG